MLFTDNIPNYLEGQPYEYAFSSNTSFEEIISSQEYFVDDITTEVQSTLREIDGQRFIFAVNLSLTEKATLTFNGDFDSFTRLNLETFCVEKVSNKVSFDVGESCILFLDDGTVDYIEKKDGKMIDGAYEVVSDSGNYLTLDKVQYSYDGVSYCQAIHYLGVFKNLLEQRYKGDLYLKYNFTIDELPKELYFLAEDMNTEWCEVNGTKVKFNGVSDFDKGIYKADISSIAVKGENQAIIKIKYYQSDEVYFALFDEKATESLVNKLVYSTNIEACYLQGDFGVYARKGLIKGKNKGVWLGKDFYIGKKKNIITDLIADGYPFFSGQITLKKKFVHDGGDCILKIGGRYGFAEVFVNDYKVDKSYFSNQIDVTQFVACGENELLVTLYTGNRNLLGPHHLVEEDCQSAGPITFGLSARCDIHELYIFGETTILT